MYMVLSSIPLRWVLTWLSIRTRRLNRYIDQYI